MAAMIVNSSVHCDAVEFQGPISGGRIGISVRSALPIEKPVLYVAASFVSSCLPVAAMNWWRRLSAATIQRPELLTGEGGYAMQDQ